MRQRLVSVLTSIILEQKVRSPESKVTGNNLCRVGSLQASCWELMWLSIFYCFQ